MSLKLGNTNIAGTQILYSTTGNNTDGAMTQKATTNELNNCVHKTGNETISGIKTFTGVGWITKIQNTNVTYNIAPSSNKNTSIIFTDKNGTQMGCIEIVRSSSNNTLVRFNVFGANGNWASKPLELMVDQNGSTTTFAPASDVNGSIVTTVNKSKATNGYFQLGNGLIINWGQGVTYGTGYSGTGTTSFSKAFSNSTPVVLTTPNNSDYSTVIAVTATTSTNFTWKKDCNSSSGAGGSFRWIAIGY